jgi:hypothetical protein
VRQGKDNQGVMQALELEMLLERFENQYQMDSRLFYQKFQSGAIGSYAIADGLGVVSDPMV